ncbi:uncharacterized protein KD926_002640 [Aspergillus affinis]|uniref:uncharacterized protein n=1 Tax=Aspergillus affinis TaxID=1070780 RepID=UPI0022FDEB9D|nr:uncharacterized protein KD926_002640 [Aspergillus affinis]KAI9035886.1 hypothetical protein KD926_002640 [Aspergillus affinis]
MGQHNSKASSAKPKGSKRKRPSSAGQGSWPLPILTVTSAPKDLVGTWSDFENGRAQRREMTLTEEAVRDGIPAIKCFISALATHFQHQNYLELFYAFIAGSNAIVYWVELRLKLSQDKWTNAFDMKLIARLDSEHIYFLYHPDTDWHAEFFDLVKNNSLPVNFLGLSENLDSLCAWMLFLRRHLNGKAAKARFYLVIPAYRPMLVKDPLEFPEELFPLTVRCDIHDSNPYVWLNLPTVDNLSSDLLHLDRIGNLARPPSEWEGPAVAAAALGTFLLGAATTIALEGAISVAFPPLAPVAAIGGIIGTVAAADGAQSTVAAFTIVTNLTRQQWMLIIQISHAQYDGFSVPVLWEDLITAYQGGGLRERTIHGRDVLPAIECYTPSRPPPTGLEAPGGQVWQSGKPVFGVWGFWVFGSGPLHVKSTSHATQGTQDTQMCVTRNKIGFAICQGALSLFYLTSPRPPHADLEIPPRYYCTFDQDPQTTIGPCLSPDPTLTALTQLGVHRFGCDRSFVSIIDGQQQHLISEATASISLRNKENHLPNDGIYLGVRTLDLEWGVCPHAIRLFTGQDPSKIVNTENITANRTRNIIRDFTTEDFYKDRPYVLEWPYFRFYAEVPLYSPSGYVLGSYCVVDNKTRTEFGDEEVAALQEIADAISQHLENVRIAHYHQRGEKLVKGLTNFVKGHKKYDLADNPARPAVSREKLSFHNLNPSDSEIHAQEPDASLPTTQSLSEKSALDRSSSMTQDEGAFSLFSETKDSGTTRPTSQPSSLAPGSPESREPSASDKFFLDSTMDEESTTERVAAIFSRAGHLLKSSMELDGVVFLDARESDSQFDLSDASGNEILSSTYEPLDSVNDPWDCLKGSRSGKHSPDNPEILCRPLNHSPSLPPIENLSPEPALTLSEHFLQMLIRNFPKGHIFDMENETDTLQGKFSRHFASRLPDAKSVLFMPLWDWNKSRWLAGTLVWTHDSRRALGMEELHYFKVFGDSIISEVSRVHWRATERSKFDFVSSISHELRSPLHGILGSTELMQSLPLQPSQQDVMKMIERSGLTLLETIDHLWASLPHIAMAFSNRTVYRLEYSKINDLATKISADTRAQAEMTDRDSGFDLDILVEEVATILCADHKSQCVTDLPVASSSTRPSAQVHHRSHSYSDEVSVVIRIEKLDSWMVRSDPGAWNSILTNIIRNAMKWTKNGLIEVTLSQVRPESGHGSSYAHARVKDTGTGISRDFLKDMLFSPFTQEDPLSPGIGLGLNISRQLAISLGGDIDIKSEMGVGTQVDIHIPIKTIQPVNIPDGHLSIPQSPVSPASTDASVIGLQLHPDVDEVPTGILSIDARRKLSIQNALEDVFARQLGWRLSPRKSFDGTPYDVAIIEEAYLNHMLIQGFLPTTDPKQLRDYFIVLGGKILLFTDDLPANIIRVSPPFGPRSLHDAAEKFLKVFKAPLHLDPTNLAPISALSITHPQISSSATNKISSTIPDPPESVVQPTESSREHTRVLLVDDNDINLKIMSTFMRKIGCHYDTASNGLIALEKYESSSQRFDFVLMDISMPVMDGLVATMKIREYERSNGIIPACIMAVTAVASNETQEVAFKAGVDDFLVKPLSLAKLRKSMQV